MILIRPRRYRLASWLCAAGTLLVLILGTIAPAAPHAASPPPAPAGLTAIALDGSVGLAWQPSTGATSYELYRGTSAATITQKLTPTSFTGTSFTDTTAANGTLYYYAVRASTDGAQSTQAQITRATPLASSCSSGNAVVRENCYPGTTAWKSPGARTLERGGVDAFLSASSINAGQSVELRTELDPGVAYRVEIYRTGYYGGSQGRLIGVIPNLTGTAQPSCLREPTTTGIVDCGGWNAGATLSTTTAWPSGAYLVKTIRQDNGNHNETILVVRDDASQSEVLYQVPTLTYQAYNNYGGKSLYSNRSDPPNTLSNATRAVKVSFDRPYNQPGVDFFNDWFSNNDVATVSWLERQGYDVSYMADQDLRADGFPARQHNVLVTGSHDEYWTQAMFDGARAARDAGTSLIFMGANAVYWRVRQEASTVTGRANRVLVTYKTAENGAVDPNGPTTTWRMPTGPNSPENALIGQMYVGDNATNAFPLRVTAAQGRDRTWRYTSLATLADGATAAIGTKIVGWEWDQRVANGQEPSGVTTVAASPVEGNLVQQNGGFYTFGSTTAETTRYRAASGALVFATGTNNWWRGLAKNVWDEGEPEARIQQATVNVLADMDARPTTLASGLQVDPLGPPAVSSRTPAAGATTVSPTAPVRATFDRALDPATVDSGDFTVTTSGGTPVAGAVAFDAATSTLSFTPADALEPFTAYTARVGTGVKSWHGDQPAAADQWGFTTGQGTPPLVTARTPASGATAVATDTPVTARFDRRLDAATVTTSSFTVRAGAAAPVAATVTYDSDTKTARLVPAARLAESTVYTVDLTSAVRATDGVAMAATSWTFTTGTDVQVTSRTPAPLASGISPAAVVRAVLSKPVDPATVNAAALRLSDAGGQPVAGSVAYDPATRTITFQPTAALTTSTTYTAIAGGQVRGTDDTPLNPSTWTFTTATVAPPGPVATSLVPAAGAPSVNNASTVRATFDLALDPATVTAQSFTLAPTAGGAPVAATVTYDAAARQATLAPLASLAVATSYTATLTTAIRSTTGAPLSASVTWSFTTADCPCALMGGRTPDWRGLAVRDNRPLPGPWTYELGTRITVAQTSTLVALKYFKEVGEGGTHVGRVWNAAGTQLASAVYENESASGWQRQALGSPITLQPGQVYTVSVGVHDMYAKTTGGLAQPIASGPLATVADGANGVYATSEGQFPTQSWAASNYFADAVVKRPTQAARVPQVTTQSPAAGATGVGTQTAVRATFNVPLDPSTLNAASFTLRDAGGATVPATVSYDEETSVATLQPNAALDAGAAYTARLTTAIRSDDETPLASAVSWTFSTVPPAPPAVTATSPAQSATHITTRTAVTATFSQAMDAATITGANVRLTGPAGAVPATVSYDAPSRTVTLTPSAQLAATTAYTAEVGTGVRSANGVALAAPATWTFTTSACPCRLFPGAVQRDYTGISTANGRGAGSWTLELGVKVAVTQPAQLEAIRYFRDAGETGAHVGRVWTANGVLLGSVAFAGETASGWQEQALATPIQLVPGQNYVVSVGVNSTFGMTLYGLASSATSGPLRSVADGANGVYGDAAGSFPTNTWGSSNYFVDAMVR